MNLEEISVNSSLSCEHQDEVMPKQFPAYISDRVYANLGLVRQFASLYAQNGVSLQKLIQRGNIELMESARKFEPTKGYSFRIYASWCIKQGLHSLIHAA